MISYHQSYKLYFAKEFRFFIISSFSLFSMNLCAEANQGHESTVYAKYFFCIYQITSNFSNTLWLTGFCCKLLSHFICADQSIEWRLERTKGYKTSKGYNQGPKNVPFEGTAFFFNSLETRVYMTNLTRSQKYAKKILISYTSSLISNLML